MNDIRLITVIPKENMQNLQNIFWTHLIPTLRSHPQYLEKIAPLIANDSTNHVESHPTLLPHNRGIIRPFFFNNVQLFSLDDTISAHLNLFQKIQLGALTDEDIKDITRLNITDENFLISILQALTTRIFSETVIVHNRTYFNIDTVLICLGAIEKLVTVETLKYIEQNMYKIYFHLNDLHSYNDIAVPLITSILQTKRKNTIPTEGKEDGLQNTQQLLSPANPKTQNAFENSKFHLDQRIKNVESFLSHYLKGQPEVIERIIDIEYQKSILGEIDPKGITLKFMGLPGVGKDTAVKTWVDGIHNQKAAWQEHLLNMPPIKSQMDFSTYVGSAPGYIDSGNIPILIKFLVDHSGGKYLIIKREELENDLGQKSFLHQTQQGEKSWYVILNPEWEGSPLPDYHTPDDGIVFLNDIHDWTKEGRNFIKTFLEEGRLRIANSGTLGSNFFFRGQKIQFVNEVIVPIIRVEASNELAHLIATNRRVDGTYNGPPQSEETLLDNWKKHHSDYQLLRKSLVEEGVSRSSIGAGDNYSFGLSTEYLNRFRDQNLLLLRPLTSSAIRDILILQLSQLNELFQNSKTGFQNLNWKFSDQLISFLVDWQHHAEDGARSVEAKIDSLIKKGIIDTIRRGYLEPPQQLVDATLDIKKNADGTSSLYFSLSNDSFFDIPLKATNVDKKKEPPSTQEVQNLFQLSDKLSGDVFGLKPIINRLSTQIAVSLSNRNTKVTARTARKSAQVYLFLGLSSIGKTELSKMLARALGYELLVIPFGDIKTMTSLEEWLLGRREYGRIRKSRLMEIWDRTNGQFVLNLDELSNAPLEIQESLYDLLREKVYSNFIDGQDRPTENLIITISDNITSEWYSTISKDIPIIHQQAAFYEIYTESMKDKSFLRTSLEKHLKAALINRVGMNNIFFFPPLSYQSIRQIVHKHLLSGIESLSLEKEDSLIGWDIRFLDKNAFRDIVKAIEVEGFELHEQAASLIHFIQNDFIIPLHALLGRQGVPIGSQVVIYLKDITEKEVKIGVLVDGHVNKDLEIILQRRNQETEKVMERPLKDIFITAAHEAGHSLMNKLLFGDASSEVRLSIIPGVVMIDDKWLRALGIHEHRLHKYLSPTKEVMISKMAALAGGYIAEELISEGQRSSAGKGNDIQRLTDLAYRTILCSGLSDQFGNMSCPKYNPSFENLMEWLQTFSEEKKQKVFNEVNAWIEAANQLTRESLKNNFQALILIANQLARSGALGEEFIKDLYNQLKSEGLLNKPQEIKTHTKPTTKQTSSKSDKPLFTRDMSLNKKVHMPGFIMDPITFLTKKKSEEVSKAPEPGKIPLIQNPQEFYSRIKRQKFVMPQIYQYDDTQSTDQTPSTSSLCTKALSVVANHSW